ncbi:hypothetical protein GCM10010524_50730 [Streptomyces mexicanus]
MDAVARQMVLHALQRQSAGGDRGAQRDVERAAPQGRVQFRAGDVRVLGGVRHARAFLCGCGRLVGPLTQGAGAPRPRRSPH